MTHEKIWTVKPKKFDDPIKQILYNRGIIDENPKRAEIEKFLEPDFSVDFFDPKLLPDFDLAIKRLSHALDNGEKIGIFADYDADGIPGAALLYRALKEFSIAAEVYIPTRQEGYGFSKKRHRLFCRPGL